MSDWKQTLAESFSGLDGSHAPLLVEIEAGDGRVRTSLNRDGLAFTDASNGVEPDLAIRLGSHSLEEALLGPTDVVAAFGDVQVASGGEWAGALPAVEIEMVTADEFELIPGATYRGVILVTQTMFGEICLVERWEDGQPSALQTAAPGRFDEIKADLRFTCTLSQLAALRRGEITPPDAFADGAILDCDWPYMTVFVELMQHRAFADVYAAAPALDAQILWGQIISSSAYAEAATKARGGQPSPA